MKQIPIRPLDYLGMLNLIVHTYGEDQEMHITMVKAAVSTHPRDALDGPRRDQLQKRFGRHILRRFDPIPDLRRALLISRLMGRPVRLCMYNLKTEDLERRIFMRVTPRTTFAQAWADYQHLIQLRDQATGAARSR